VDFGAAFVADAEPAMPLRSRPGSHIGVEAALLHALRRGVNVRVPGLLPGAHSRLCGQQKASISGAFMELAGLEPATSWARSRRSLSPKSGLVRQFLPPKDDSPNTFPNTLSAVLQ
jgi:hypothetical protein